MFDRKHQKEVGLVSETRPRKKNVSSVLAPYDVEKKKGSKKELAHRSLK